MATHTVTTSTSYSTLNAADGDDIIVNSGGILSLDSAWAGADGSRAVAGVLINLNGSHIQDAGTTLVLEATKKIQINEGGQHRSIGTSGSRCAITGEGIGSAGHYAIYTNQGGKVYLDYTDITNFLIGMYENFGGIYELRNSTISSVGQYCFFSVRGGSITMSDCTFAAASTLYCFYGQYDLTVKAISCTFTSVTDNRLATATYAAELSFTDCTYQGTDIAPDDFPITFDMDIEIYEKSSVTVAGNLAGVQVSASHPSLDSNGLLYDDTNYIKIPGFLPPAVTNASGVTNLYLLKRSAYWRSGLAVGSRTWKYWSDSGQAKTGDNQKWSIAMAKDGYAIATDSDWAGNAMTGSMAETSDNFRFDGETW